MKTKSLFTRGVKIAYIVVLLLYAVSASSQNERGRIRTDSLRNVLQKAKTPEEKLTVLKELTTINRQQKVDVSLGKELVDMMRVKIQTLRRDGELKEAIQVYKNMLETNAAINDKAFDRQMTQIRVLNDLNDTEKRVRELNYHRFPPTATNSYFGDDRCTADPVISLIPLVSPCPASEE